MGHRRRGHRISRQVAPIRQGPVIPITHEAIWAPRPVGKSAQPMQRMLKQTKGARKWMNGTPTIHYSRDGYIWVGGRYVKGVNPHATGITFRFSTNRQQHRAALSKRG